VTATGNLCECGHLATFMVCVSDGPPVGVHAHYARVWATCDEHLIRDAARCVASAGFAKPHVVLRPEYGWKLAHADA
jgi:hypothetical protein